MAAGVQVSVRNDIKSSVLRLEASSTKAVRASAARALNRTATTVRKEASKEIRKHYNLKASVIKAQLRIRRASQGQLVTEIVASGKRIPLIQFVVGNRQPGRRRRAGVRARVTRRVVTYAHAFIAQMPNQHVGVFVRTGKFGRRGKPYLERIKQLVGISIPKAMSEAKVNSALARLAAQRFRIEFERDLRFRLNR